MISGQEYVQGIFITEIKNRFLCLVHINGEDVVCYIPSSCRLSNFIDLTNRTVLLKPVLTPNARTKFSVYALKYGRNYILLNLSQANRVIEEQIYRRYFSFLGKRKTVFREVKIQEYKSDLYIKDTNTLIEIKSLLCFEKCGIFPTVYSERAISQLKKILVLLNEGYKVCYMLISLNPQVKEVVINHNIDDYYNLFCQCVDRGMEFRGFSVHLREGIPEIYAKIPLLLK